jgi:thiaminase (transcriptional activator TenA)
MNPEVSVIEFPEVFRVPSFAARCFRAARHEWEEAEEHPFVRALVVGSLDPDRFRFYQMQDARYLEAYADACSLISVRMRTPKVKMWFIEGARLAMVVERQLHQEYGRIFGYNADQIAAMELSPDNRAYQNHMLAAAQSGSLLDAIASLTPCAWMYSDLGVRILEELGEITDDHPYADWLRTYADQSFIDYTNELMAQLELQAEVCRSEKLLASAEEHFRLSVRYEYRFWEQAWNRQAW